VIQSRSKSRAPRHSLRCTVQGLQLRAYPVGQAHALPGISRTGVELIWRRTPPVAIGRRNWIDTGSSQAGPKIAAILSVVESCLRLKLPVRDYLATVLPGLADCPIHRLPELTPAAMATQRYCLRQPASFCACTDWNSPPPSPCIHRRLIFDGAEN
jgi:hypothetical protein